MSKHQVINRPELAEATLNLGGEPLSLAPYATTGLLSGVHGLSAAASV